jgi:hypothetical protein
MRRHRETDGVLMSRLWDTKEFWARSGADGLLGDYPAISPRDLAAQLTYGAAIDGDRTYTEAVIVELRKRAEAGVRFWPDEAPADVHAELQAAADYDERDENAPLGSPANPYWWQRL